MAYLLAATSRNVGRMAFHAGSYPSVVAFGPIGDVGVASCGGESNGERVLPSLSSRQKPSQQLVSLCPPA